MVVAVTGPVEIPAEDITPEDVTDDAVTGPNDAPVVIDSVLAVIPSDVDNPPPDEIKLVTVAELAVIPPVELTEPNVPAPAGAEKDAAVTLPLDDKLPTLAVAALREPVAVACTNVPVLAVMTPAVLTAAMVSVPAAVMDPTAVMEPLVLMLPACREVETATALAVREPDTAADAAVRVLAALMDDAVTEPVDRLPDCTRPVTTSAALVTVPAVLTEADVKPPTTFRPA